MQLVEFQKDVVRILGDWRGAVDFAAWADELKWFQEISTQVALVASSICIATGRAFTFDKPVREKSPVLLTIELSCHPFLEVAILVEFQEDFLRDVGLQLGRSAAENVEADVEPVIHLCVDGVVLVAKFLGGAFLHKSSCLGRGPVLIGP